MSDELSEKFYIGDIDQDLLLSFLPNSINGLQTIKEELIALAQKQIEIYWIEWRALASDNQNNRKVTRICPRIKYQKKGDTYSIVWSYFELHNKYAYDIPKGKSDTYNRNKVLSYAHEWEYSLFDRFEPFFSRIRTTLKAINKLRTNTNKAQSHLINTFFIDEL